MDISKCDPSKFVEGLYTSVVLLENFILEPRYHSIGKYRLYCYREMTCGMGLDGETQQREKGHVEENQGFLAKFPVNSMRDLPRHYKEYNHPVSPQKWVRKHMIVVLNLVSFHL